MPTEKITKTAVDRLQPGDLLWDSEVAGFGCRCQTKGKFYVLKSRDPGGKQRWITIGKHGDLAPDQARRQATKLRGEFAVGGDPAAERDADKQAKATTVAPMIERFLAEHADAKRKSSTATEYRRLTVKHILPVIGDKPVSKVTRPDIARLHHEMRETPYLANRVLAVLSKFFNWAEANGYRSDGSNPCRHVGKFKEEKRERYLSEQELARVGGVLVAEAAAGTSPYIVAALRLLIFTGCRLREILTLRWQDVDAKNRVLRLPDSKTGAKVIQLNAPALEVLSSLPQVEGNPYVIVGEREGRHLINLEKPWYRIREVAGLNEVRLHDLRHSFASIAAGLGNSLVIIGGLLGHTQTQTTARYAHLSASPLQAANEAIGARLATAMAGGASPTAPVESLAAKRHQKTPPA